MTVIRSYFCSCHNKQIGPSSHTRSFAGSLGTWHCPINGNRCKVIVRLAEYHNASTIDTASGVDNNGAHDDAGAKRA